MSKRVVLFSNATVKEFVEYKQSTDKAVRRFEEELTEHLDAINDNTSELQANQELIQDLDRKFNKLNEKFDRILMLLEEQQQMQPQVEVEPLTLREQEVFVAFYMLEDGASMRYIDVTHRTGLPMDLIKKIIQSIIVKGIPIVKRYKNTELHLELDAEFKHMQTKTNILQLNEQLVQQMVQEV